ncbi:MFS transporter [Desulforhopalus singaporensis]|uniref:Predicted arabinose efflux permease, MFS family n=1 Tax=Desulforhopalus singaporensis TaxID=91360 RepID=A0A1H0QDZ8_9BACT|nr:MFS transporter [Desulforhopalus singaporensis]SDP14906.1 Predicted arabinose efflux permease, MFS family [Desulforhopalus singaporensis]
MAAEKGANYTIMKTKLPCQLLVIFFFRLLLNTGRRFIYPFAPLLGRSLGVPLSAITSVLAFSQFVSLAGVVSGPVTDIIGTRFMMRMGLAMLAVGMLICGLVPHYWFVFFGLVLGSMGKTVFDPAIQSFIGNYVPYERRGRVVGLIETSWAGATLIGIPALGLIIDHGGLPGCFVILGVLGGLSWMAIGALVVSDGEKTGQRLGAGALFTSIIGLFHVRPAAGLLGFGFWISLANDSLFVVYGNWFEQEFMVGVATLGFSTVAIGSAELMGEGVTAFFADRAGLKKMVTIGLTMSIGAYLLLPVIGQNLFFAMVGIFLVFLFFETTMVTSFSLGTELLPGSRATMMAGFYATAGMGRMAGVLLGGVLWQVGGIQAVSWSAALLSAVGLLSLRWGLKGWRPPKSSSSHS